MNSSVKFLEPIVIAGLLALAAFLVIVLALAVLVVDACVELPPLLPDLSLLSSPPQAARPKTEARARTARTLRDRMIRFLLMGVGSVGSFSPRGVTARWSAPNSS